MVRDKGIYVVYSLECNAARTPLCLVAQKVTQCETEMTKKRLKQLFYFYSVGIDNAAALLLHGEPSTYIP